jgi:hypothetical protein
VSPDDAGRGAAPHRRAKLASLPSRSGLSRAVTTQRAGDLDTHAVDRQQARCRERRPVPRGPRPLRRRIDRIVAALTLIPSLMSSPRIRMQPNRGFSRTIRQDELRDLGIDRRTTRCSDLAVGPLPLHQLAVPAEQRPGADEERGPALPRQDPGDGRSRARSKLVQRGRGRVRRRTFS